MASEMGSMSWETPGRNEAWAASKLAKAKLGSRHVLNNHRAVIQIVTHISF